MDKREELISIATELFSERGFESTPLSLICDKANVSKGLISHHFKSKNGLLREIFLKTTTTIIEINNVDKSRSTAKEQLRELLESFFLQLESDKMHFQFNLNIIAHPYTRAILSDLIKERSELILESVQKIFTQIDPETSLIMSHMLIAELDGISLNYLAIYEDFPLHEIKTLFIKKYI